MELRLGILVNGTLWPRLRRSEAMAKPPRRVPLREQKNLSAAGLLPHLIDEMRFTAAGLPVVSSDWEALRQLSPPVRRCAS
jgi:hypothetical protein